MPERYLLQVMKTLKDAGLVLSLRSVQGGYKLAKPIGQISLQDVCEAISGAVLAAGVGDRRANRSFATTD